MERNKILMLKLGTGEFIRRRMGAGREQFNINENAIIDGNYYGVILNRGDWKNIPLERIDTKADKHTDKLEGVLLIYFAEIESTTCIVAIAKNTTVFREVQTDEYITKSRVHKYEYGGKHRIEHVGYHTITTVENMYLLKQSYIPITTQKGDGFYFRGQRAYLKEDSYKELEEQIFDKVFTFLNDSETDLQYDQIENATPVSGRDSKSEDLIYTTSSSGNPQINKKAWVSKNAIKNAHYRCEYDPNHETFLTNKGFPFMEGHHLIRCTVRTSEEFWERYNRNIDTESNIVSLCPNCHRKIHFGSVGEKLNMLEQLYELKCDGLHNDGILLTLDELKKNYALL